jgi:bacteriorhodopsin
MALIRSIFWFALFVASTFCFIVVFEHGFTNFGDNAKKEAESLKIVFGLGAKKAAPAK